MQQGTVFVVAGGEGNSGVPPGYVDAAAVIAADGGVDRALALGLRIDLAIGDFDSVSEKALRCGALLIVHGYRDGRAPGAAARPDRHGGGVRSPGLAPRAPRAP